MEFTNSRWKKYFRARLTDLMTKYGLNDPVVVEMKGGYYLAEKSEVEEGDFIMLYQTRVITHARREELSMIALP